MILDALWLFTGGTTGVGNSDGLTDSPTTGAQFSSNVVDVGELNGIPPSSSATPPAPFGIGGPRDMGIGDNPALKLMVIVTLAFTTGTSLQISVQGAPDSGSNTPGTYTAYGFGPIVAVANLTAGVRIADIDMPRVAPGVNLPRYYRLGYTSVGSSFGAGKIEGLFVLDRFDQPISSANLLSGYYPGVTVAN